MNAALILLVVIVLLVLALVGVYNSFIAKRNQVRNIASTVDTQLKKRYDLIPNLVSATREYMSHENAVLTRVSELRSQAINAASNADKFRLNSEISALLGQIRIAVEAYPNLKANESFAKLQNALGECEEQISAARRAYNGAVTVYNNACEMFPTNIIANVFNFVKAEFFAASEQEKQAPNVSELFKK
ncbi:LemA family protein [uncultured Campylobacter sp.]|uniref:LemA family protein n=1 Tax=uncultured Campylobacter sp. TaxID=218934 RepID=UPI00262FB5FA|nr:LemA family protein [uncultured Campylobacter sp.]